MDGTKSVTATFTQNSQNGIYDDADAEWTYTGTWTAMPSEGSYADTLHYSTSNGNEAQVPFTGQQVKLIYLASPISGSLDVYVDNSKVTTINQFSAYWEMQKAWTSDLLAEGAHTLRVVAASGDFTTVDAIQVIATPVILSTGVYDDTNAELSYTGRWYPLEGITGPYADTLRYSVTSGNDIQVNFAGQQIKFSYLASPVSGVADVYVDGVKIRTINQNSANWDWQQTWTSDLLAAGNHSLRLVHVSGDLVSIDAITVVTTPVGLSSGVYDNADAAFGYEGRWYTLEAVTGPYADTLRYSVTSGNDAQVTFNGRQVKVTYLATPTSGIVDVYVDGVKVTSIDQHSETWDWQKTWTSDLLAAGNHSLRIVHASGGFTNVDAITVVATPVILTSGEYDDANPALSYEGNWLTMEAVTGPYADTLHYSIRAGEAAQVSFNGRQITLTYLAAPTAGSVDIYVDGVMVTTLNQHSETWDWQQIWTSGELSLGDHSLRIVHSSGDSNAFGNIDAITVIP